MGKKINDPLGILTKTSSDTLVEENGHDPLGILKKKDNTVGEAESSKQSNQLGSEESGAASEPPTKPSGSLTVGNPNDPFGIGETIAKTVYSGFAHQLPGAIASLPGLNNQSYEDYLLSKESAAKKRTIAGGLFTESLKNLELKKAFSVGDKEIKEQFLKELKNSIGEEQFNKNKKEYETKIANETLEGRKKYEESSGKRQELLGDIPQSYSDIKNPVDAARYLAFQFGQAVPTMVAAGLAPGVGSYVLEATDSYNENVDETAKALKKTPKEIIKEGLDKPAKEIASNVGLINAALDIGGIGSIAAGLRSMLTKEAGKQIAKRGLSAKLVGALKEPLLIEPVTETIQEANTAYSSQKAAGKTDAEAAQYVKENYPRLVDSFIGGLTGAGGAKVIMGGTVKQTIESAKQNIKSTDNLEEIKKSADAISEKVKEEPKPTPTEGVQNAVQEQSTSSILQHPQEGVGETGSERGRMEPSEQGKEITGTRKVENESTPIPEQQEKETLNQNQQQNENDTGIRRTIQETGIQTEQGKGSEEPRSSSSFDRTGEVRSEENGEVRSSGEETSQQINEEAQNQPETIQATPQESEPGDAGGIAAPPRSEGGEGIVQEPANSKQFAVAKRILASDANPAIKQGIKEQGDSYIPKGLNVTEQEAQDLIDHHGPDKSELMIKDPANGITPDTRVVLSGKLYEKYSKEGQNDKAVDTAIWAENFLMQAGRAANAGKFWKMITSSGEDQIVLAIERQQEHLRQSALSDIDRATAKNQLEAEFRRLVEEKVQSTVEGRLEAAKLITKDKRKEIGDFFDKLKVDTKNNIATASILPIGVLPHVWNAAIDVIKQAVLTGADVANAIQAGIDHIKANQKEPFDEQKFRDEFTPEVQKIIPKKKIKPSDIDSSKIKTPKILGQKKIDFINKVVESYNKGELTDKKFDEIYASKLGFREFTSEDRAKIRKLAKTISESEKYDQQLRALPADQFTRENIEKMKGLREAAKNANQQLQEYSQAPADVFDTLISIMQANLMSTMSLVSNVWYNLTYTPLRSSSLGLATMVDYGLQKMARVGLMPKALDSKTIDFTAIQKGYFQGAWNGLLEGLKQVKTGTQADERNLREIQSKFNPSKAMERWQDKDRTVAQKANDYIEGTVGWEAEGVFRLLNLGDKPFKRAAEWARANEIGSLKGLKGKELEKFLLLPDAESEAEIVKAGREATFQQDTAGGKIVQNALTQFLNFVRTVPLIGGPAKVIIKSQIPFVKTPLNLIIETIQYAAPPVTLATGVYQISKGNKRSGSILVGKSIVGAMLWQASIQLFLKGLLTGDDDKDKKKRDFQSEGHTPPPNSINTSAISRGLAFGDWSIHDGDTWVSYTKMGVAGICLDNYSNIYKERIAKGGTIAGGPESYMTDMLESTPRVGSSTIEQSFLQGTSSALEALKSGDERTMNNWLIKTTESVGSILYPNTIATIAKASDEFSRDTNDEELWQHLKNVYKAKMFAGDELPAKVSLWGDKIKGNPEGRNKYAYYLFDPSKFKDISTDDFRFRLYQAFKTDYSPDWLPSMPTRSIVANGQKIKLTPKEYEELCISVGKERAALVSSYINSQTGTQKNNEDTKSELKMRYDLGYELGKEKFMISKGMNVKFHFRKPLEMRSMTHKLNKQKGKF